MTTDGSKRRRRFRTEPRRKYYAKYRTLRMSRRLFGTIIVPNFRCTFPRNHN